MSADKRQPKDERERLEQEPLPASQPEEGEPSGAGDESAEREIQEATERAEAADGEPEAAGGEPEAADDELTRLRRERDEYLALAQRTQADFENYRKRAAKDAAGAGERAKAGLVRELLPVLDNLERALASADAPDESLAEGVKLVHAELVAVLQRSGVEAFDPTGESFDPTLHEALTTRPADDGAHPGTVVQVVEKGYKLNDTVLRPARVVVSS
ncbi:MAG: nucleotide exchange factor GrpE [Thermoleophilaceae bacterium]|nr:nucleotide exchange factor GrpE [Thermoleophilaceae bacterium]